MPNTKPAIYKYHEAWAVKNGYRKKLQAPSAKPQAPSCKPEDLNAANSDQFVKAASTKRQAAS